MNAHREAHFRDAPRAMPLPNSEYAQDRRVILPLYPQMTDAEQDYVIEHVRGALSPA
jgi:dTDP-4-amino-4,6-dideoxygalactose transaminase